MAQDSFKLFDDSTHCVTLSDVPIVNVMSLPRISPTDKLDIIPSTSGHPIPKSWKEASSVPLHWTEVKPVEYYEALLKICNASTVVDLQGCAAIATAAFKLNVQYLGMCAGPKHANWLSNVVDRSIIRVLINSNHPLYAQGLAELLEKHFSDELEVDNNFESQEPSFDED